MVLGRNANRALAVVCMARIPAKSPPRASAALSPRHLRDILASALQYISTLTYLNEDVLKNATVS